MFDWEELRTVNKIIEQLRTTSSTNDKISILNSNKDNEMLKKVLFYTYDSNMKYGMQKKSISKDYELLFFDDFWKTPFKMFDELSKSNINNELKNKVNNYIYEILPYDLKNLIICIILKDLKIKINSKTINKVFPNLIYVFSCQLGEPIEKAKIKDGEQIYITKKLNGTRAVYFNNRLYARSGKEIEGFQNIKDEIKQLAIDGITLDGELVRINRGNKIDDEDNFSLSLSSIKSKERTNEEESQIEYVLFDILPTSEFIQGKSTMLYSERRKLLDGLNTKGLKHIRVTNILYQGTYTKEKADKLLELANKRGYEGLMCNLDAPYECKRVKTLLKMKTFYSDDLRCIDVYEGEKDFQGMLGGITVQFHNNTVNVGTGFSVEQRQYYWNNPEKIINHIVEVKYKGLSKNKKNDNVSLNFPVFICVREDKDVESYES